MRTAAAVLLFVEGGITLLISLFMGFFALFGPLMMLAEGPQPDDPDPLFMGIFYGGIGLVSFALALAQLVGGYCALKKKSWTMALIGGVCGILSGLMCCNMLGMALGLIATILLALPEARMDFEHRPPPVY